ncbi:hypothetical protein Bca4012_089346 [Brassica carinata]|uniref:Uncharacterized protein n=2 Tax=Brassica TaxID=3705 RepID=A0A8X7TNB7_BRACI|nr:hypothetical protein Bca52824_087129 [Brassica carinata]
MKGPLLSKSGHITIIGDSSSTDEQTPLKGCSIVSSMYTRTFLELDRVCCEFGPNCCSNSSFDSSKR